jgi:hypothetical protein
MTWEEARDQASKDHNWYDWQEVYMRGTEDERLHIVEKAAKLYALAAMREIYEIAWEAGKNWADHDPSTMDSPNPYPDLNECIEQLFP